MSDLNNAGGINGDNVQSYTRSGKTIGPGTTETSLLSNLQKRAPVAEIIAVVYFFS